MLNVKTILVVAVSLQFSLAALAERLPWPDKVFDCQVITVDNAQGLVNMQTFSLEDARKGVVGLPAVTLAGNRGTAARVVQCIEQGSGQKFTDSSFQAWFEQLAL